MKDCNILLVDTNRGSYPLLKTLEANGYNVTTVGSDSSAPLARLSRRYIEADYTNQATLQAIVDEGSYLAIIPGCTDASYLACAALINHSKKGIDKEDAIFKVFNKQGLRDLAKNLGISQPSELSEIDAINSQGILIKPVDSFSGAGIIKLDKPSRSSLQAGIERARKMSPSNEIIIEDFVEGQLYSHSAFLKKQEIERDFFVKEDCSDYPYSVDTSCLAQDLSITPIKQVRRDVARLASELQLKDGLLHTQFILRNETAYIIEMTRRHPGDLYGLLIQYSTGIDYSAHYLNAFLPDPCKDNVIESKNPYIIRHTITAGSGVNLWSLAFKHKALIRQWIPLANVGTHLSAAPQGRAAIVFFEQHSKEELEEVYKLLTSRMLYTFLD